jgi:formamidase
MGAERGDVIAVDVLGIGRADGRYGGTAHPGVIGCAPAPDAMTRPRHGNGPNPETGADDAPLLGHVRPGLAAYERIAAEAARTVERGHDVATCAIARLVPGSRILLPVHAPGAKLSVGDLHFPWADADDCDLAAMAGWIDLRIHLTKRGIERFRISGPLLMPDPDPTPEP